MQGYGGATIQPSSGLPTGQTEYMTPIEASSTTKNSMSSRSVPLPQLSIIPSGFLDLSRELSAGTVSAVHAPVSTHGHTEASPALQIVKNIVKGALGVLSSAAEGIPVPGVKGIFDTVSKVIGIVEVSSFI